MHQPPGLMYQRYPIGPHQSRYPLSQFDDGENEDGDSENDDGDSEDDNIDDDGDELRMLSRSISDCK